MRSLHQIVRSVLLTEGVSTPTNIDIRELRKIALSTYMFRMFPVEYRSSYKSTDVIRNRVNFTTGDPIVKIEQQEKFREVYQGIVSTYGSPTGNGKIKIKKAVFDAMNRGKSFWPISVIMPESSMYDKEIIPEDVFFALVSVSSKSAEDFQGDLDLSRITGLPAAITNPIKDISDACMILLKSKSKQHEQLQETAKEIIETIKSIVEDLSSAAPDNETHDGSVDDYDSERFALGSMFEMMSLKEALSGIDLDDDGDESGAGAKVDAIAASPDKLSAEEPESSDEESESSDENDALLKLDAAIDYLDDAINENPLVVGDSTDIKGNILKIKSLIEPYLADLKT